MASKTLKPGTERKKILPMNIETEIFEIFEHVTIK
jgi:hypothetical protein